MQWHNYNYYNNTKTKNIFFFLYFAPNVKPSIVSSYVYILLFFVLQMFADYSIGSDIKRKNNKKKIKEFLFLKICIKVEAVS